MMADELTPPAIATPAPDSLQTAQQPARPSLLGILFSVESGGRNVTQGNIGDINNKTGDLAQGFFQITTGTWNDYAPLAGVDTRLYPTALQAPYPVQARVASVIPLERWGPNTINAIKTYYPEVNTKLSLGQNVAATGGNFIANAPGNAHDSRFQLASGRGAYGGDYSLASDTAPPRRPRNFLESVNDAIAESAPQQQQPPVAPQPSPLAGIAVQPIALPQQPVRPPAPVQVPRPIDYYQALLSRKTLEPASG